MIMSAYTKLFTDLSNTCCNHCSSNDYFFNVFFSKFKCHLKSCLLQSISFKTLRNNMNSQTKVSTSMKLEDGRQLYIRLSTLPELVSQRNL